MAFPVWLSPVAVNYSSAKLPPFFERRSVTYYELSESGSEGEQGHIGDTRRTVYTKQFLINLRRSSTKLDDSVISKLRLMGILYRLRGN
jgi:hypothetical protein